MTFEEAFETAYINAIIREQDKKKIREAKKAYTAELVKQGVDKEMAKIMCNTFFEYGLVRAL